MEASPHVLVVDDHREIREPLGRYLERHDMRVTVVGGSAAARRALRAAAVDLVVLDIMMPGEDGLALCRHLRETTRIPVILLTAMAEETDRIVGLEVGADDYVTKPFSPRELLARIRAVLRRSQSLPPEREPRSAATYRFESLVAGHGPARAGGRVRCRDAALDGRVPAARGVAGTARDGALAGSDPRPDAGPPRRSVRPGRRQPGQPAAPEDRARPEESEAHRHGLGRRLPVRGRSGTCMRQRGVMSIGSGRTPDGPKADGSNGFRPTHEGPSFHCPAHASDLCLPALPLRMSHRFADAGADTPAGPHLRVVPPLWRRSMAGPGVKCGQSIRGPPEAGRAGTRARRTTLEVLRPCHVHNTDSPSSRSRSCW